MPDDPVEAVEGRRPGGGHGREGVGEDVERMSVCGGVPSSARESLAAAPRDVAMLN